MKLQGSLVFYIGNGVVKGAIVCHEKGKIPKVLCTRVRDIPHFNERNREHLESKILSEFTELLMDIKTKDFKNATDLNLKIDNTCVVLSSPWYLSESSVIKIKEQKPFLVTEALLQGSRDNIIKAYRDAHQVDVVVLEQKIIRVSLNGYPTNEPIKKKAQSLDMTIFTSFARHGSIEEIRKIIDSNFHTKNIDIHSQSLLAFSIISDAWKDASQYIIADITSELTELVAVRRGVLSEASSFPKGKRFLVKTIAESLGVSTEVGESLLKMHSKDSIEPELAKKVDAALEKAKVQWLTDFTEALAPMSSSSSLPNKFFMFSPKDSAHIFSKFIAEEEYQQFSFAEGKFEVNEVKAADFNTLCMTVPGATPELAVILGAVFNNKLIGAKL